MTQEDAMNMSTEQAIQILKPLQMMMRDQNGCPISDAYFALGKAIEALEQKVDAVERRRGNWTEKHHAYSDEESVVEEWQSCRCSECGRYDTRPYMYYFSEPNYCSYCGADMRGEKNATD